MQSSSSLPLPPDHADPPAAPTPQIRLTLTLPPLRSVKKGLGLSKKQKGKLPLYPDPPVQKTPRPIKLKPLKEVLTKLITQIKKKDDYAFFLQPVDTSKVSGYTDVVKNPMDFGTMTTKVDRGKYRSLEEFTADLRLVASNARAFNPPASLFHTEATRIETWGLDHVARASSHVIEYETDWNIDVVADEEPAPAPPAGADAGPSAAAPLARREADEGASARSPSVMSVPGQGGPPERAKRGARAASKKGAGGVSESFEPEGQLPGSKDGLGVFPPESDYAALMLALKLKGKRYRTKKERLRIEKEGPPYRADGSLDYTEMEDPFSVLRTLVPDPLTQPHVIPILSAPTLPVPPADVPGGTPQSEAEAPAPPARNPAPAAIPPDAASALVSGPSKSTTGAAPVSNGRHKHWTIVRNPPTRSRAREADDLGENSSVSRPLKKPRVAEATDYGAFSMLAGTLLAERGLGVDGFSRVLGTEDKLFEEIRQAVQRRDPAGAQSGVLRNVANEKGADIEDERRTLERALDAEEYLTDVVYGGVDGLAYVRSLAEFVGGLPPIEVKDEEEDLSTPTRNLGMGLAHWVALHVVDPLTSGMHSLLRGAAQVLADPSTLPPPELSSHLEFAAQDTSELRAHLDTLARLTDADTQIDLAVLLHAPHELFVAESEWAGAAYKAQRARAREQRESSLAVRDATGFLAYAIEHHRQSELELGAVRGALGDTVEVIEHALDVGAEAIVAMDRRLRQDGEGKVPGDVGGVEDPAMRKLRLNLLAVAKRAPLEKIARLPAELVPPHIRHIVPTLTS